MDNRNNLDQEEDSDLSDYNSYSFDDDEDDAIAGEYDYIRYFETLSDVKAMFTNDVKELRNELNDIADDGTARLLLRRYEWNVQEAVRQYRLDPARALEEARIRGRELPAASGCDSANENQIGVCMICYDGVEETNFASLSCGHQFCKTCWKKYVKHQMKREGIFADISCMGENCSILLPQEFVLKFISTRKRLVERYHLFCLKDWIRGHPLLRYCPGENCEAVIRAEEHQAKEINCKFCNTKFCWRCREVYHAPISCSSMTEWGRDESQSDNYILAFTQKCPSCKVSIDKNSGCDHMTCTRCRHEFCWNCLQAWPSVCRDYRCSKKTKADKKKAAAAAEYRRFEDAEKKFDIQARCLRSEKLLMDTINERVAELLVEGEGGWTDYRYLNEAVVELARGRRALQFSYLYAYYLKKGKRDLIEYKQNEAETIVDDLSFKLEKPTLAQKDFIANLVSRLKSMTEYFENLN